MELYDAQKMPLSSDQELRQIQERFANGQKVVSAKFGRDQQRIKKKLGDYQCKSNYCYRAISSDIYELYKKNGFINDPRPNSKEYEEHIDENGNITYNNSGIDWYLGGAAPGSEYGEIVIECPADKQYFRPSIDNGCKMTFDSTVRHMKSSPKANPIPFSMITNVFDYRKIKEQEKAKFDMIRQQEMLKMAQLREQQIGNSILSNQEQLSTGGMSR